MMGRWAYQMVKQFRWYVQPFWYTCERVRAGLSFQLGTLSTRTKWWRATRRIFWYHRRPIPLLLTKRKGYLRYTNWPWKILVKKGVRSPDPGSTTWFLFVSVCKCILNSELSRRSLTHDATKITPPFDTEMQCIFTLAEHNEVVVQASEQVRRPGRRSRPFTRRGCALRVLLFTSGAACL